jgi:hypothetical protein
MTIPSWPAGLSNALLSVSGYTEDAYAEPVVRTGMEVGPPKARARYTSIPIKFEGTLDTLTSAQVDTLLAFWETTCLMGSLLFTWVHPRTGAAATFMWMKFPAVTTSNGAGTVFAAAISLLQFPG